MRWLETRGHFRKKRLKREVPQYRRGTTQVLALKEENEDRGITKEMQCVDISLTVI